MGQRIRANAQELRHSRRPQLWRWLILLVLIALLGTGWWLWHAPEGAKKEWQNLQASAQALLKPTPAAQPAPQDSNAPLDANSQPQELANTDTDAEALRRGLALNADEPLNPIEAPVELASTALPTLENSDSPISQSLGAWGVTQSARSLIRNEQFIRRFVATVDNLPSPRASSALWPIFPTAPRFTVLESDSGTETTIAAANSARYTLAVQFLHNFNVAQAARDYKYYYPLFQQAYEELGYPSHYFNDRLIAVIDHLLQAPAPLNPRVILMPIRGQVPSEQPWMRYEFEDPQLEALSAGQKILVRMGPDNAAKVKAKLRELRAAIASIPAGPSTQTP